MGYKQKIKNNKKEIAIITIALIMVVGMVFIVTPEVAPVDNQNKDSPPIHSPTAYGEIQNDEITSVTYITTSNQNSPHSVEDIIIEWNDTTISHVNSTDSHIYFETGESDNMFDNDPPVKEIHIELDEESINPLQREDEVDVAFTNVGQQLFDYIYVPDYLLEEEDGIIIYEPVDDDHPNFEDYRIVEGDESFSGDPISENSQYIHENGTYVVLSSSSA